MFQLRRVAFGAACALVLASAPPLFAATPQDTLVMAYQIDDMITLDPAEVFEFTGAEYAANVYDRLVTYPPDDVADLQRPRRRELGDRRRRQDLHLQGQGRHHLPFRQSADRRGRRLVAAARDQAQQDAGVHPDPVRLHAGERRGPDPGGRRPHLHGRARPALRADLLPLLPDRDRRLGGRQAAGAGARAGRRSRPRLAARPRPPAPGRSSCARGSRTSR